MTTRNGTNKSGEPSNGETTAPPIFGKQGRAFELAGETHHYKAYSLRGIEGLKDSLREINFPLLPMANASFGTMLVEGSVGTSNFEPLLQVLNLITGETFDESIFEQADGDELAVVIDGFFAQSGMRWIESLLKNFVPRAEKVMEIQMGQMIDQALTGISENPSA
jgi:hypothetical protein